MTTKHTPGPWAIVPQIFRGIETYKIKGPAKTGPQMVGRIEYEADARLIAAAPIMYETLKTVHNIINSYGHIPAIAEACRKLQAAIAAAEVKP